MSRSKWRLTSRLCQAAAAALLTGAALATPGHAEGVLNGQTIGVHSDPYVPFTIPATSVKPGAPNESDYFVQNGADAAVLASERSAALVAA